MSKRKYFRKRRPVIEEYNEILQNYRDKYFNLFRAQFKWDGLNYRQEEYIMRKFYGFGTIAAARANGLQDELVFAPWAQNAVDQYGLPEQINLLNEYNSPVIPSGNLIVDKDACIGYIQRNKKPVKAKVEYYIKQLAEVELVIRNQLNLHKLPYVISVSDDINEENLQDIIDKIMNNEQYISTIGIDPNDIDILNTNVPYLIDKLYSYKISIENELKTYLGIDNQGVEKTEQLQLSEISSGNQEIDDCRNVFLDCLKEWCKNIKDTFGITISVESTSQDTISDGEYHKIDENNLPGRHKEESEDKVDE